MLVRQLQHYYTIDIYRQIRNIEMKDLNSLLLVINHPKISQVRFPIQRV